MKSSAPSEHRRRAGQAGVALVSVLWLLILLSIIALNVSVGSRIDTKLAGNLVQAAKARHLADAGINWALWSLTVPDEERWLADGSVQEMELEDALVRVALFDESGKIDINAVTPELLSGLFRAAEIEEDLAAPLVDAILDWRDEDDLRRLNGAEDEDYFAAGREAGAKDALFESLEELKQVLGMTDAVYAAIAPALTIHSRRIAINPLFAPRLVLLALPGATPAMVDRYIEERRRNHADGLPPPENPEIQFQFLPPTTRGVNYTIHTEATVVPLAISRVKAEIRHRGRSQQGAFEVLNISPAKAPLFSAETP